MRPESYLQERDPSTQCEEFRQSILEPVDEISGERVKRTAGVFSVVNVSGEPIEIHFATCTHEDEPGSRAASEAEVSFLRNHLVQQDTQVEILLAEQGSPKTTQNHIQTIINQITESNPELAGEIQERMAQKEKKITDSGYSSEIHMIPEELEQQGCQSVNLDLTLNPSAYKYVLDDRGLETLVLNACCELGDYVVHWKESLPDLVVEVFKKCPGLSEVDLEKVKVIAEGHLNPLEEIYDLYESEENYGMDNQYREKFMAAQIRALPAGTYKLLCHTGHLVGIVDNLKSNISQIETQATEVALHTLAKQKEALSRRKDREAKKLSSLSKQI